MQTHETELLDLNQTCKLLNTKKNHLRALVFRREIPVHRIGRLLRFDYAELINWLKTGTTESQKK